MIKFSPFPHPTGLKNTYMIFLSPGNPQSQFIVYARPCFAFLGQDCHLATMAWENEFLNSRTIKFLF